MGATPAGVPCYGGPWDGGGCLAPFHSWDGPRMTRPAPPWSRSNTG
jgi:hypothetical protein